MNDYLDTYLIGATGGAGTTTCTVALAVKANGSAHVLDDDRLDDLYAVAGMPTPTEPAPVVFGDGPRFIDCGTARPPAGATQVTIVVRGPSYLALRRALPLVTEFPSARLLLLVEPGRALNMSDALAVLGDRPTIVLHVDEAVARAVDSGLLTYRLPRSVGALSTMAEVAGCSYSPAEVG